MKRIIALVLGLAILAAAPVLGDPGAPPKEEVVYAHLSADGAVNRIFVVNAFLDASGRITDYGDYRRVVNLTNTDQIKQSGQRVQVNTEPGNFFYQGELAGTEMPWLIGIDYLLDGRPVSASELRGQSGELAIEIQVRRNADVEPVFFDNYMLQISVNLDGQYFSRVAAEGATIAASGATTVVNFTALPGRESDFRITTSANNAHVGQIQIAGLPFKMMMELPDASEYLGDLVALQDAIALLADGVDQFTSGVDQLDAAGGELSTGAATLADNARLISQGFDELAAGRGEFDAGLRLYNDGIQEFSAGMSALADGISQFTAGIDQLSDGSSQLASGLGTYSTGVAQFSDGLNQTSQGSQQLTNGVAELSEGLRQLTEQGKYADPSLVSGSAQILAALEAMDAALSFPMTAEELELLLGLLQTVSAAFEDFAKAVDQTDFDTFLALLRESLARFDDSVAEIERIAAALQDSSAITAQLGIDVTDNPEAQALLAYMAEQGRQLDAASAELRSIRAALGGLDPLLQGLLTALEQLRDQYDTVRDLIGRLNAAIQAISVEDIQQLAEGIALLSANYRTFHEGLVAYVDGVEQAYLGVSGDPGLLSGARDLSDGLGILAASGGELAAGASELADGAAQLNDGIGQLQDGAAQFADQGGLIVDGANQLAAGGNDLVTGHAQLLSGDRQLGTGLWLYASGVDSYASGVRQFSDGLGVLGAGGQELSGGADTLRDETSDMDQQMTERIDEAMADFLPSDFTLVSFADPRNTGIERVQFVYLVDAQTEPAPEPAEPDAVGDKSIWDRILDIFR